MKTFGLFGNRKRDRTPSPVEPVKIICISQTSFKRIQELCKRLCVISRRQPEQHKKQPRQRFISASSQTSSYEPTNILYTRQSAFWQWQRVKDWFEYINDPYENIMGT